jgi:hypothetical protein
MNVHRDTVNACVRLLVCGLLKASFVPPPPIRELRCHDRKPA